ncbi:MAG TPA: DUF2934 domain-containing protein [Acetobacteraceae bacterium]|nr:DUF2934 domain-containing protein [Acetobacteraceae bacterium]
MSASSDANRQPEHDAAHREHRIRERAFFLWQEAGSPEGREEEFWHRAEELEQGGAMSSSQAGAPQADPTGQNEAPEPVEERDAAANAAGETGAVPTGRIETSLNRP